MVIQAMVMRWQVFHGFFTPNILLPDLRGHGKSEGYYIGFGWDDRRDIMKWINVIIDDFGKDVKIILFGISMVSMYDKW